jgi:hypothetical protein
MARARFIRPEFFTDVKLADLSFGACMLFAGIWCHSDLRGVFEHDPRALRGLIFPMRDGIDTATVGKWLAELESIGCIGRFEVSGKSWGFVRKWTEHQTISGREKEIGSPRPPPPNDQGTTQARHGDDPGTTRVATPTPTPTPTATETRARPQRPPPPPSEIKPGEALLIRHNRKTGPRQLAEWKCVLSQNLPEWRGYSTDDILDALDWVLHKKPEVHYANHAPPHLAEWRSRNPPAPKESTGEPSPNP